MKKLYPEDDVLIKAKIDQKLYFDMGTFYQVALDDFVSGAYIYIPISFLSLFWILHPTD